MQDAAVHARKPIVPEELALRTAMIWLAQSANLIEPECSGELRHLATARVTLLDAFGLRGDTAPIATPFRRFRP